MQEVSIAAEPKRHPDYEALGIFPTTPACVFVGSKADAKRYVWALALYGVQCSVSLDADGKRYHVAVPGGLASQPAAWLATLRPEPTSIPQCSAEAQGQHPQATK